MKWAIREAVDVYFKAKSVFKLGARTIRAGEPVLIFDTVKTSTLEVAAEVSYVTGGRGNARLLSYEGDKTLTFNFEDALLSAEGLAILSGADLIPARNKHLKGASPDARSVISHYTEKYSVVTGNRIDSDATNVYPDDESLYPAGGATTGKDYSPMGGVLSVWLTRKPYVGQNASIYVMLLDQAGEMSGAPLEVNLNNDSKIVKFTAVDGGAAEDTPAGVTIADESDIGAKEERSFLSKFNSGDYFVAFDKNGLPIPKEKDSALSNVIYYPDPADAEQAAEFDDHVAYYVGLESLVNSDGSLKNSWTSSWKDGVNAKTIAKFVRQITAPNFGDYWGQVKDGKYYSYLLAPSGGVAQPKAHKEGNSFYYKLNVPSILYQDIVLLDYYVEYRHDATQVSILPDKFGPYLYVEGSSLVRRASDGMDLPVEFVIPKFKVTTALTFTLTGSGDASSFNFQGDAYPDFSKFDLTRKVLADIQILDADDNYDGASGDTSGDPTSYRRYRYNDDTDGEYLWKDPSIAAHDNLDYSDTYDAQHVKVGNKAYAPTDGGPATRTEGVGLIDTARYKDPVDTGVYAGPDTASAGAHPSATP